MQEEEDKEPKQLQQEEQEKEETPPCEESKTPDPQQQQESAAAGDENAVAVVEEQRNQIPAEAEGETETKKEEEEEPPGSSSAGQEEVAGEHADENTGQSKEATEQTAEDTSSHPDTHSNGSGTARVGADEPLTTRAPVAARPEEEGEEERPSTDETSAGGENEPRAEDPQSQDNDDSGGAVVGAPPAAGAEESDRPAQPTDGAPEKEEEGQRAVEGEDAERTDPAADPSHTSSQPPAGTSTHGEEGVESSSEETKKEGGDAKEEEQRGDDAAAAADGTDSPAPVKDEEEGVDDDERTTAALSLLSAFEDERNELQQKIEEVDNETTRRLREYAAKQSKAEDEITAARERTQQLRESTIDMKAEIEAFPTDEELQHWRQERLRLQGTQVENTVKETEFAASVLEIEKSMLFEETLTANLLEEFLSQLVPVYGFTRRKKYLYGSIEKPSVFDPMAMMEVIDENAELQETSSRALNFELCRKAEEEEQLDAECLEQKDRYQQEQREINTEREALAVNLAESFHFEKEQAAKIKKKYEVLCRENEYHLRRGSSQARSTQLSAEDKRLQEKQHVLQRDLKKGVEDFEKLREEIVEHEHLGNRLIAELEGKRRLNSTRLQDEQQQLKEHRLYTKELRESKKTFRALKEDLEFLVRHRRQLKITDAARQEQERLLPQKHWPASQRVIAARVHAKATADAAKHAQMAAVSAAAKHRRADRDEDLAAKAKVTQEAASRAKTLADAAASAQTAAEREAEEEARLEEALRLEEREEESKLLSLERRRREAESELRLEKEAAEVES